MKNNRVLFFCFLLASTLFVNLQAQEDSVSKKLPVINVSLGIINYIGDISTAENSAQVYNPTIGFQFGGQYILWNTLGVDLHGFYGLASLEKQSSTVKHNFKTLMLGAGLDLSFHFDNGFIMKKGSKMAPFIFAGIMPFAYYPRGDYRDDDGGYYYYYWTDGSVRNIEERSPLASTAVEVTKDDEYEFSYRTITGSSFSTMAIAIKGGLGSKFIVNNWLSAQVKVAYNFTNTDYLDGYNGNNANDGFFFGSIGLDFNPNVLLSKSSSKSKKGDKNEYEDINIDEFLSLDTDGDGVPDLLDKCSGTTPGVKVNEEGCSEIKPSIAAEDIDSMAMMPDSLVVLRETLCEKYPIMCGESDSEYPEVNERSKRVKKKTTKVKEVKLTNESILEIVKIADVNNDGKVDLPELYNAIEQFFDADERLSLSDLRKLIDYFFDQY